MLELPWRDNVEYVSCIPIGRYAIRWTKSKRFGRMMYLIDRVPKRKGVRIHSANTIEELQGCIAPGNAVQLFDRRWGVARSADSLSGLQGHFDRQPWTLDIVHTEPPNADVNLIALLDAKLARSGGTRLSDMMGPQA